jgi:hypothetical protein
LTEGYQTLLILLLETHFSVNRLTTGGSPFDVTPAGNQDISRIFVWTPLERKDDTEKPKIPAILDGSFKQEFRP